MKKQQGTLTIQVQYDENGKPHMKLTSEFNTEQSIEILNTLLELISQAVPSNRAYEYLSTPYLN